MRILTLFVLLAATLVSAQDFDDVDYDLEAMNNSTVVPSPSTTTTSPPPSTTTTSPPPSSTVGPTSTTPPPASPQPKNYSLPDSSGSKKVCFSMSAVINVVVKKTANGEETTVGNWTLSQNGGGVVLPNSMCYIQNKTATIFIAEDNQNKDFILEFMFNGSGNSWNFAQVKMGVNIDNEEVNFELNGTLDRNSKNLNDKRSFKCTELDFDFINETGTDLKPYLKLTDLQVQVFQFDDSGDLGKSTTCAADNNQGNKIVPIAVGAALAGLVIVVLIAYLIGRLRSRKQSSYEALS